MVQSSAIYVRNPGLVWRPLEDELVIVRPSDGQIRVLNGVGSFIWQALDGQRSCADMAQLLCTEYEVSEAHAKADVIEIQLLLKDAEDNLTSRYCRQVQCRPNELEK